MEHNWLMYIAAFAVAFGVSIFVTPYCRGISIRLGAIDEPKNRGMHHKPIPRLGGIALVAGFAVTIALMIPFLEELRTMEVAGLFAGGIIIVAIGILDDVYNIKARTKLILQMVAASVVIASGTYIEFVFWPFATHLHVFAIPLTFLWIIGITNAVNLIDGLDGLAAGVASICAICLVVLCIISGEPVAVVLSAALAGTCLGFLPRNFSPAEIFMGDTGALFLGYVLAVTSIIGVFKTYAMLSLIIAMLALALPIFDTIFAMGRRVISRQSIMTADRSHLHHKLIDAGLSTNRAVMFLYAISFVCAALAVAIAIQDVRALLVVVVFASALVVMTFTYRHRRQDKNVIDITPALEDNARRRAKE